MAKSLRRRNRFLKPHSIIFVSFIWAIVLGTGLLLSPWATTNGISFVDALFTATSAVCVTGLTVVPTQSAFTHFGQWVIMGLIQVGGVGIMTLSTFFLVLFGHRLNFSSKRVVEEGMMGRLQNLSARTLILWICGLTFTIEAVGSVLLFFRFWQLGYEPAKAAYFALFHSVSAFCNAGFDLFGDSLTRFRSDVYVVFVFAALIILGGLGFVVLMNLIRNIGLPKATRKISLLTKISVVSSAVLLGSGFLFFLFAEGDGMFWDMNHSTTFLSAFFLSVVPRTAGFYSVNIGELTYASTAFVMVLMFIGAASGSTGGGVKTTTFSVMFAASRSLVKGSKHVELMNRTIPERAVREATSVVFLSVLFVFVCFLVMLAFEHGNELITSDFFERLLFECISAFATVGLSTGITPALTVPGKVLLCVMMLVGRVGPLVVSLSIGRQVLVADVKYPEEPVMVG